MTKNILNKFLAAMLLITSIALAQDEQDVDAIEKARQAKEAAEKAAAEASAATEAAIEAAAQKAAKEARLDAKRKKEEEEARKLAEAKAAEEAELDAAASAAAEEAKRKMAEELGLEYEAPQESDDADPVVSDTTESEEFVAKENSGFSIGGAASVGFLSGASFTSVPLGATLVIETPLGFKVGPFDYTVSVALGGYQGKYDSKEDSDFVLADGGSHILDEFNPMLAAIGGNLTVANLVFAEGHVGLVGAGPGFRGFAGVSLEKLMNKGLNLPFNVLVGSEGFISSDMGSGNPSGWASLGLRLDINL
tara:strand:- start:412 stop:1332 length:921 start_codon:yes stop_codon:yes gene_type:complete